MYLINLLFDKPRRKKCIVRCQSLGYVYDNLGRNNEFKYSFSSKLKAVSSFLWLIQLGICNYCIRKVK